MQCLLKEHGYTLTDVQAVAECKRQSKGGFDAKIYVSFVEMPEDHKSLAYYKARPDQYPETHLDRKEK